MQHSSQSSQGNGPTLVHICYGGLGGHNAVVVNLMEQHKLLGYRSEVLLLARQEEMMSDPDSWPNAEKVWPVIIKRRGDLSSLYKVFKTLKNRNDLIIICHTHRHMISAWLGTWRSPGASLLVLAEHQPVSLRTTSDNLWSFVGVILSRVVVLLTPEYKNAYKWRFLANSLKRPLVVIPNGVKIPISIQRRVREPNDELNIGMASRLSDSKDIETLIKATRIMKDKNRVCPKLLIAGNGPNRLKLEQLVIHLGLTGSVEFLGNLDREQLHSFFEILDVYVQSTKAETLSMAVLEAASWALPIVATDVEGVNNILEQNKHALLYRAGDHRDLASKIESLIESGRAIEMGLRAQQHVIEKYNSELVAETYIHLLRKFSDNSY